MTKINYCLTIFVTFGLFACGEGAPGGNGGRENSKLNKLILNDTGVTYFISDASEPFYEHKTNSTGVLELAGLDPSLYKQSGSPKLFGVMDQTQYPKIPFTAFVADFSEPTQFPGQDGSNGNDVNNNNDIDGHAGFSFTKLDKLNGTALDINATEWGCVQDNVTEMVWEHKTNTDPKTDYHSARAIFSWYDTNPSTNGGDPGQQDGGACPKDIVLGDTEKLVQMVNQEKLCGFDDWRMPTIEELRSIINYQVKSGTLARPAMTDQRFFPYLADRKHMWSSQTVARDGFRDKAYGFHFDTGQAQAHFKSCQPSDGKVNDFFNGAMLVRSNNDNVN